mmetsp:Transcript_13966/g.34521  ORF Transcript_13966/g.34521 Transcript_13966/m.34521 type:complete len:646 (+) Transcript_13966:172-2109(+)
MLLRAFRALLAQHVFGGTATAEVKMWFANKSPHRLDVQWLPRDRENDEVRGSRVGSVPPGDESSGVPGRYEINTFERDAFRMTFPDSALEIPSEKKRTPAVAKDGSPYTLVVVEANGDQTVLHSTALKRIAAGAGRNGAPAKCDAENGAENSPTSPDFNLDLSPDFNLHLLLSDSALKSVVDAIDATVPTVLARSTKWAKMIPRSGALPPDELVVFNLLAEPVVLSALTDGDGGAHHGVQFVVDGAEKEKEGDEDVGTAMMRIRAPAKSGFELLGEKFEYPGELLLVVVTGERSVKLFTEDELKVLFAEQALGSGCLEEIEEMKSSGKEGGGDENGRAVEQVFPTSSLSEGDDELFHDCFASRAVVPGTEKKAEAEAETWGHPMPPEFAHVWFKQFWESYRHFHLCNVQPDTPAIKEFNVTLIDGRSVAVKQLREDPAIGVYIVDGLGTEEDCQFLTEHTGVDKLVRATVTTKDGYSKSRRTMSRNLYPRYDTELPEGSDGRKLADLGRKMFNVTNSLTGYDLDVAGQEPVNYLYYKAGYEYRPHCDGPCGVAPKSAGEGRRVCTSLLYCVEPEWGGSTVFPKDRIKYTPKRGGLMLFTYNPDVESYSYHSACPVIKGFKTTATQWYRTGVNAKETWEIFLKKHY